MCHNVDPGLNWAELEIGKFLDDFIRDQLLFTKAKIFKSVRHDLVGNVTQNLASFNLSNTDGCLSNLYEIRVIKTLVSKLLLFEQIV